MHNGSVHTCFFFFINSAVLVLRVRLRRRPSRRMQWRMSPTRPWTYSGIYGEPTRSAGWSVFLTFIAMFSLLFTAAHSIATCSFSSILLLLFAHAGSLYSSLHSPENDTLCSSYNHKPTLCHPSCHYLWLFPLTGCIVSFPCASVTRVLSLFLMSCCVSSESSSQALSLFNKVGLLDVVIQCLERHPQNAELAISAGRSN